MKYFDRVGEENINSQGCNMKIIKYNNADDIDVQFDNYIRRNVSYKSFKNGSIKNLYHPEVFDFGFMGEGVYKSRIEGKKTEEYIKWYHIIIRAYDPYYINKYPTYKNVTVCDEWRNFQVFASWWTKNKWTDELNLIPDKDILCHNQNKIYSPDTVVLVDNKINSLFIKCDSSRGLLPIGVCYSKEKDRYSASCCNDKTSRHLGFFQTPEEAFARYKEFKEAYIKQVANEYKNKYPNFPEKLYKVMIEYEVDIND